MKNLSKNLDILHQLLMQLLKIGNKKENKIFNQIVIVINTWIK
jgi:hypothetical protein